MLGAAIDITERKRDEEAFRASEARLAAGSELAGLGYYEADDGTRSCFLDERLRAICGVPEEVNEGLDPVQFWSEHIHPEDRQRVQTERQKLHNGNVDQISVEYRYLHPALGQRWLHHSTRVAERRPGGAGMRAFGVVRDITRYKQLAEEQAEDSGFANLIADLSSKFVNVPAAEVDSAIEDAQRRVCEFLGLDLSSLWQPVIGTSDEYRLTHHHRSAGGPPIRHMSAKDNFPWCLQRLLAGDVIAISSPDELPPEAARDRDVWRFLGIKTSLTVPMSTGGASAIGFLSFNDLTRERDWPAKLVNRLQLVAHIFANALARKLADQQLRESEEVNRATFEQAGVGIAHVGADGRLLRVNDKLCAILGYPREELMQLTFQSITHPDDLETDLDLMRQILSGRISNYSMAKRYFRKDRSLVWADLTVSLVRNDAGGPKHFISVVEDITERKRGEEALRQSEERLRLVLEANSEGVWDWNIPSGQAYFSSRYSGMLGYTPEEFAKDFASWKELVHPDDFPRVHQAHHDHLEEGKEFCVEFRMRMRTGDWCWIRARGMVVERDTEGRAIRMVGTHQDITERKNAEASVLQQRAELAHLSRVAMLGELSGSMAHELNQPLTAILSNAQAAQRFLAGEEADLAEVRDILADIVAEDKRAGEIIRRLRLLLKKGEVQHQPVGVNEVVLEVLKLVRSDLVNQNVAVQTQLAPDLPDVEGDRVQLQQVLLNLVMNACEAMAGTESSARQLTIRTDRSGDGAVRVSVADCGPGIVPDELEQIFESFYTTKPQGMGLSLAVCRTIITAHNGKLWAANNPAAGATLHFTFPIREEGQGARDEGRGTREGANL